MFENQERHGRTCTQWVRELRAAVAQRANSVRCSKPGDPAVGAIIEKHPLWDYWSSGYTPEAAAEEMVDAED